MNYLHQHKPRAIIHRDLTPRYIAIWIFLFMLIVLDTWLACQITRVSDSLLLGKVHQSN
jgi:hypothetical protein